ncbi:uncharacterized protein PFL1_02860 [Pseudozyma flocculosa PF-1]|uniref:Uncharacterized protein n=2 Tax=Pseudozyma flocculosa TaxID=84751 RepID=A0A5C3F3F1_9BASI|nr:uncharacterized protein PFL1_02860 [Pseudozyma flocculosa PF-1]EPQ29640.1 hypothetical protein PFL1_02860 [Pseudozyma flocculosa PF-1]SPO38207.1 uncharacterized protein PSFLO_03684 [Pseudozyma flocculosa]
MILAAPPRLCDSTGHHAPSMTTVVEIARDRLEVVEAKLRDAKPVDARGRRVVLRLGSTRRASSGLTISCARLERQTRPRSDRTDLVRPWPRDQRATSARGTAPRPAARSQPAPQWRTGDHQRARDRGQRGQAQRTGEQATTGRRLRRLSPVASGLIDSSASSPSPVRTRTRAAAADVPSAQLPCRPVWSSMHRLFDHRRGLDAARGLTVRQLPDLCPPARLLWMTDVDPFPRHSSPPFGHNLDFRPCLYAHLLSGSGSHSRCSPTSASKRLGSGVETRLNIGQRALISASEARKPNRVTRSLSSSLAFGHKRYGLPSSTTRSRKRPFAAALASRRAAHASAHASAQRRWLAFVAKGKT